MLDPIRLSPDDLMGTPIASVVDRAADCVERWLRLIELPPSNGRDAVLEREKELFRVRNISVRCRAVEATIYLRRSYGADVDAAMVRRDPALICYVVRQKAGAYMEPEDA